MDDMLAIVGAGVVMTAGFVSGFYSNIYNMVKLRRNLEKKDYIILSIVDEVSGVEDEKIVERKADIITWGIYAWVAKEAKYYLRLPAEDATKTKEDKFSKSGAKLGIRQGVSILYVNRKDYIPTEISPPRKDAASAEAINSGMQAEIMHKTAKRMNKFMDVLGKVDMKLWLILGALAIIGYLVFSGNGGTYDMCKNALNATMGR